MNAATNKLGLESAEVSFPQDQDTPSPPDDLHELDGWASGYDYYRHDPAMRLVPLTQAARHYSLAMAALEGAQAGAAFLTREWQSGHYGHDTPLKFVHSAYAIVRERERQAKAALKELAGAALRYGK